MNYPLDLGYLGVLTFGTASGLVVAPGWDNVTGLGVANPVPFIAALMPPGNAASP